LLKIVIASKCIGGLYNRAIIVFVKNPLRDINKIRKITEYYNPVFIDLSATGCGDFI